MCHENTAWHEADIMKVSASLERWHLTLTRPALLFPAISLLLLAYTNRLALAQTGAEIKPGEAP
ncbi:hypothetical protein C1H69_10755 [Billgrantia endophytica]|uniref:Uncharacterized protein n=1 Tax=Billgrantia endophytica TaxID=2033802 RepID=A0A2N7U4M7_9GAMM|nr:hypothetical protein C1H69_10755 [Halomonas endophytica]